MGTAFLRCEEANVLDAHRAALREPTDACTVVTDMITGRPARYIRNKLVEDLMASDLRPVAFPAQLSLTAPLGNTGDRELTALFAGQSAALAETRRLECWSHRSWKRHQHACELSRAPDPSVGQVPTVVYRLFLAAWFQN